MFVLDESDVMIDQQGQQDQTIRIQSVHAKYFYLKVTIFAGTNV